MDAPPEKNETFLVGDGGIDPQWNQNIQRPSSSKTSIILLWYHIQYMYVYIYIYIYIWAPVKIIYMWVVATLMVIVFGGGLSLSRVLWKSAYSRSNMKPKSIPKQARKWIEELFCWFQVLRQHFMFLSFCVHLHAYSFHFAFISCHFPFILFHVPFICIHFLHFPFIFLSCSFQFAFMSFHLPFICIHFPFILHSCPFISFLKLWKWLYGLARGPSATKGYR